MHTPECSTPCIVGPPGQLAKVVTTGMVSKAAGRVFFSKPLEILPLIIFFLSFNIDILSLFEVNFEPKEKVGKQSQLPSPPAPTAAPVTSNFEEQIEEDGQIITFKEDGQFGNLLMETATLILIGQNHNMPVKILPQVGVKLSKYLSPLPAPIVDHTMHCICTYYTDCHCPTCQKRTKVVLWNYRVFGNERYKCFCLLRRLKMCSQNLNQWKKFAIYRTF